MDIETQTSIQEQLPQIRRISKLDDIPRVIPPRQILPPERKIKTPKRGRYFIKYFVLIIIVLLFLESFLVLVGINRYNKLYKLHERLYQISLSLNDRITALQQKLQYANKLNDKLVASRKGLIKDYLELGSQYKILQFKMDDYRNISMAKSSKIDTLEGNLAVAYARVEAAGVQNEILAKDLKEKGEYIRELTSKLINNIGEQEILVSENLRLKEERERLAKELTGLKESIQAGPMEDKDANK